MASYNEHEKNISFSNRPADLSKIELNYDTNLIDIIVKNV